MRRHFKILMMIEIIIFIGIFLTGARCLAAETKKELPKTEEKNEHETNTAVKIDAWYNSDNTLKKVAVSYINAVSPLFIGEYEDKKTFVFEDLKSIKPLGRIVNKGNSIIWINDSDNDSFEPFIFDITENQCFDIYLNAGSESLYALQAEIVFNPAEVDASDFKNLAFAEDEKTTETDNGTLYWSDNSAAGYCAVKKTADRFRIVSSFVDKNRSMSGNVVKVSFKGKKNGKTVILLKNIKCCRIEENEIIDLNDNCLTLTKLDKS